MSRIEELEKRLAADPNSRIFVQLAEEYRKQGLLENAIEICETGLTKHPQYPSARVALGRALLEAETFDRASEEFEAVLAQVPDNILANKFLGETYHRLGRYDEAIQKYQIAQTLAPEDAELEGKIEAVKAEVAGGGPPPPPTAPDPADVTAPADPGEYVSTPPPIPGAVDAPLEPTLVDARAVDPNAPQAPPPEAAQQAQQAQQAPPPAPEEPLAPIPLVAVDEPMVLESPAESYAARAREPTGASDDSVEPVPLTSPSDPPPIGPPAMEPPAPEPAVMAPPPVAPAPTEPPPFEPPPFEAEPPPMEPPPIVVTPEPPTMPAPPTMETPAPIEVLPVLDTLPPGTPPVVEAMDVMEPPAIEATPVTPLPVEPLSPEPPTPPSAPSAGADGIETPTMAELYASQGHFDKAANVYRNLLARDPNETQYLERIEELEMLAKATVDSAAAAPAAPVEPRGDGLSESGRQETIEVLEQWLDGIRRSRRV